MVNLSLGKVVLGTAKGNVHDIGRNLVGMVLEGGGFEVVELGTDLPEEKFVQAMKEHGGQGITSIGARHDDNK